ncbi:LOW QUALITY PROTEIN: signal transducer and activator of transcription 1 [Latimeria chalumnae]|uniref:LOW QUALITY PROTEIN: signal transducer and activator of transcription 1 n=1 Tax=Latimeria chalumnae TaxID=7897 RepID=UPI00313CFEB2
MSQWERLQELEFAYLQQVDELYSGNRLPMEVRHYLAHWIEAQDWDQAVNKVSLATILFQNLLENLDIQYSRFSQEPNKFVLQHNFRLFKHNIQADFQEKPMELAWIMSNSLKEEKKILTMGLAQGQQGNLEQAPQSQKTERQKDIEQKLNELKNAVQIMEQEVRFLEEEQDDFDFRLKNHSYQANCNPSDPALKTEQQNLQVMLNNLDKNRKGVLSAQKYRAKAEALLEILVNEELVEWKRRQQTACIGAPEDTSLDNLENWFTHAAESLLPLKMLLKKLEELREKMTYEETPFQTDQLVIQQGALQLLDKLMKSAFVVESQPISVMSKRPLVLKTSTQFSVRARLLVKLPDSSHRMNVTASIDKYPRKEKGYRRFNILGTSSKSLNSDDSRSKGLVVDFKYLTLKEQKAGVSGKGYNDGSLSVTEELHLLWFETDFEYQGWLVKLETSSLPVVIISNVSQHSSGWASILWYNTVCTDGLNLLLFNNSPVANWPQLSEMLSWQFLSTSQRGLNPDQLAMLAEKLFGIQVNYSECCISWSRFSKENLPNMQFSFWTWIDGILVLIKNHLEEIWKDGLIMGFVNKEKEKALLKPMETGTFLLRFSESSREGAITFSWVEQQANGRNRIRSVQPYTKLDLSSLPLGEIIRNYQLLAEENVPENPLKFLYPNIPKDDVFGKHYLQKDKAGSESNCKKYLKTKLIMVSERHLDEPHPPELMDVQDDHFLMIDPMNSINVLDFGLEFQNQLLLHEDQDPLMPVSELLLQ